MIHPCFPGRVGARNTRDAIAISCACRWRSLAPSQSIAHLGARRRPDLQCNAVVRLARPSSSAVMVLPVAPGCKTFRSSANGVASDKSKSRVWPGEACYHLDTLSPAATRITSTRQPLTPRQVPQPFNPHAKAISHSTVRYDRSVRNRRMTNDTNSV